MLELLLSGMSSDSGTASHPLILDKTFLSPDFTSDTRVTNVFTDGAGTVFVLGTITSATGRVWVFEKNDQGAYVQKQAISVSDYSGPKAFYSEGVLFVGSWNSASAQGQFYAYKKNAQTGQWGVVVGIGSTDTYSKAIGGYGGCAKGEWVFATGKPSASSMYVNCFKLENNVYVRKQIITATSNALMAEEDQQMTFDGEYLFISELNNAPGGSVKVYRLANDQFTLVQEITSGISNHNFGKRFMQIDADTLLILGAPGGSFTAYIYLYKRVAGSFVKVNETTGRNDNAQNFGLALRRYKDYIVFGHTAANDFKGLVAFYKGIKKNALEIVPEMTLSGSVVNGRFGSGLGVIDDELIVGRRTGANQNLSVYKPAPNA